VSGGIAARVVDDLQEVRQQETERARPWMTRAVSSSGAQGSRNSNARARERDDQASRWSGLAFVDVDWMPSWVQSDVSVIQ